MILNNNNCHSLEMSVFLITFNMNKPIVNMWHDYIRRDHKPFTIMPHQEVKSMMRESIWGLL